MVAGRGAPDGVGGNLNSTPVAIWPLLIDAASGDGQALPMPAHERDTGARRAVWPLQAAWSPDGSAILTATNGFYTGEAMDSLDAASPRARIAVRRMDVASGEMTLLGGLPTGIAVPFFLASWGAAATRSSTATPDPRGGVGAFANRPIGVN